MAGALCGSRARLLLVLEGGYELGALGESVVAMCEGLCLLRGGGVGPGVGPGGSDDQVLAQKPGTGSGDGTGSGGAGRVDNEAGASPEQVRRWAAAAEEEERFLQPEPLQRVREVVGQVRRAHNL